MNLRPAAFVPRSAASLSATVIVAAALWTTSAIFAPQAARAQDAKNSDAKKAEPAKAAGKSDEEIWADYDAAGGQR